VIRHRSDHNQSEIVETLRAIGCAVYVIGRPLDLLIYVPGKQKYFLADVKNPNGRGRRLTKEQKRFTEKWPGPWYLLESVDDALELVK
jgi:hypothetical protein